MSDADNELFQLLNPYTSDLRTFFGAQSKIVLTSSSNPSRKGSNVTFTASVSLRDGTPPGGEIKFEFVTGSITLVSPGVARTGITSGRSQPRAGRWSAAAQA
jgi:hypothetical protein